MPILTRKLDAHVILSAQTHLLRRCTWTSARPLAGRQNTLARKRADTHTQSTLLPVRLVLDIGLQHHLALTRDIIHHHIKHGQEITVILFTERQHLGAERLKSLKRRGKVDFKHKRLADRSRSANILDDLGSEDIVPDPDVFAVETAEIGREEVHLDAGVADRVDGDAVSDVKGVLDEQEDAYLLARNSMIQWRTYKTR